MPEMVSAIDNALTGLQSATRKVDTAAQNIANVSTPGYTTENGDTVDLSEEAVNMVIGKTAFKANVSVLNTAAEMDKDLQRLFDKKA
jgi:flagellar hook protein FlgE